MVRLSSEIRAAHVHANVPMVSAADADLLRMPPVTGCSLPSGHPLSEIVGRVEMDALVEAVNSDQRVHLLTGPAGVGKTTVARAATLTLRERDPLRAIWWIAARDRGSLVEGLAALAAELRADDAEVSRARESVSRRAVWRIIEQALTVAAEGPRRLLVVDGVDDPDDLRAVLAGSRGLVSKNVLMVVTTRREAAVSDVVGVHRAPVGLLDPHSCAELLLRRLPDVGRAEFAELADAAGAVADRLGRLPLALHVAGTRHGSTLVRRTLPGLVAKLDGLGAAAGRADDPVRCVSLAVQVALEAIPATDRRVVAVVLHLLAALAPGQPFPLAALDVAVRAPAAGDVGTDEEWIPLLERGRRTLVHTGLAAFGVDGACLVVSVHPLVAEAVRRTPALSRPPMLPGGNLPTGFAATAVDRVTRELGDRPASDATLSLWRLVGPHVGHLLTGVGTATDEVVLRAALRAAERTARHLTARGMYDAAFHLAELALERTGGLDADDPARLTARLRVALVHQQRGYYDSLETGEESDRPTEDLQGKAYAEITKVVAAEQSRRGPLSRDDRLRRLRAEHHLAAIQHDRGRLTEAEQLFGKVFVARVDLLGPNDPRTIATGHRLARVLHAAGKAGEALELLRGVLASGDMTHGPDHPDTLSVKQSLAYAQQAIGGQDSLRTAEREFAAVFARRRVVLGENHPNTLVTRHNLAWIEQARGRYVAAERLFREVLEIQLRRCGRDHPHALATAANLAWDLQQRREFSTARLLFMQVLRIRHSRLGLNHPDTQTTRGNIGWLTYEQGDFREATGRFEKLVDDRVRTIGPKHPRTLTTRHNLALSLRAQGDYPRAIEQFGQVLTIQKQVIGNDHESTLSTRYNLAVTHQLDGNLDLGIELLEDVLDRQLKVFSARHPAVVQSRDDLITAWRQRRRPDDLDRASDERNPSRTAWALSRHRSALKYDDEPMDRADGADPLLTAFLDSDIADYRDPDLPPANEGR
jgi:tetratricopeptide (TPR) repeat protein